MQLYLSFQEKNSENPLYYILRGRCRLAMNSVVRARDDFYHAFQIAKERDEGENIRCTPISILSSIRRNFSTTYSK